MPKLSAQELEDKHDRALLDFLCAAAAGGLIVRVIKPAMRGSLRRLREAGLVAPHGFLASPSAQIEWYERRKAGPGIFVETPGANASAPAGPPVLVAIEGGAQGKKAPPSTRKRTMAEKAKAFEAKKQSSAAPPAASIRRGVPSSARGAVAPSLPVRASPASDSEPRQEGLRPWDPPKPPAEPPLTRGEKVSRNMIVKRRQGIVAAATRALDAGKTPGQFPMGDVRMVMKSIAAQRELDRRASCSIEQAKLILQRRGVVVFAAHVNGGPAGKYRVGSTTMSEAELIAYAGKFIK